MSIKPFFSLEGISERLELYVDQVAIVPIREADLIKEGSMAIPYSAITSIILDKGGLFTSGSLRMVLLGIEDKSSGFYSASDDDMIKFLFLSNSRNWEKAVKIKKFIESHNEKR